MDENEGMGQTPRALDDLSGMLVSPSCLAA